MKIRIEKSPLIAIFIFIGILWATCATPDDDLLVGGDISALLRMEDLGAKYRENGKIKSAEKIMSDRGANIFRLRLFVNPTQQGMVVQDLPYIIKLAKRIKATGAKIFLTLHYSDTWTNPGQQSKPIIWESLNYESLAVEVREYTRKTIEKMDSEGVLPDFVAIGNEISPGFLWPEGKIDGSEDQWLKFSQLFKAAVEGIEKTGKRENIKIVLHIHGGDNSKISKPFFDKVGILGIPYDVIGLSFYPWWGRIEDLKTNLNSLASSFNKDIIIVETAFLFKPHVEPNWRIKQWQWTTSRCGQQKYVVDIIRTATSTTNGRVKGVIWWFPESSPIYGQHIWLAGKASLFDEDGTPLPAMKVLLSNKAYKHPLTIPYCESPP